MKNLNYLFIALIVTTIGCASPKKLYEKGNYAKAYDKVLKNLKKKNSNRDRTLLNKAYAKLIIQEQQKLRDIFGSESQRDFIHNFKLYRDLRERYINGEQFLDDKNKATFVEVDTDRKSLIDKTIDIGDRYMEKYDQTEKKAYAQTAYRYYDIVKDFGKDYFNITERQDEALEKGSIVINIVPDINFNYSHRFAINNRFDDLEGRQGFKLVYYDNSSVKPDCYVELDFDALYDNVSRNSSTKTYSKEVKDGYTVTVDTSGKEIKTTKFITVTGEVTTHSLTKTTSWRVDFEVRDVTGNCGLNDDRYNVKREEKITDVEISGDRRAIPNEFLNYTRKNFRDENQVVGDLLDDLYTQIRNHIY